MINGIITVTGAHDTGKTTFAVEAAVDPARICLISDDVKDKAGIDDLEFRDIPFGRFVDAVSETKGLKENSYHKWGKGILDSIQPGQFDVLVWDTWTRFQKTFHSYVQSHRKEFRDKWSPMGQIKGAQEWIEAERYEAQFLNQLQSKVPLVIPVIHLKDDYRGNVKTGKKKPAHGKCLNRVPRLRLWLKHNPNSRTPIALVMKRTDMKIYIQDVGLRTVSVLPRKITPRPWPITTDYPGSQETDKSLWDTINWYIQNPIDRRDPFPEETPDKYELSILDGTLTEDEKLVLRANLQAEAEAESQMNDLLDEARARCQEIIEENPNISDVELVLKLRNEIESGDLVYNADDITVKKVMSWR